MTNSAVQLSLSLVPHDSFAPEHFVAHRGVNEVFAAVNHLIDELRSHLESEEELGFHFLYISGPSGSGKTHLGRVIEAKVAEMPLEIPCRVFEFHGVGNETESDISAFIDAYQRMRGVGGVLVVLANQPPEDEAWNPHLSSRFRCALPLVIDYPADDELSPLVRSVVSRMNLRFTESQMEYLLKRLPNRPLSLAHVFDRISNLALTEGKPVGRNVFRAILESN